MYAVIDLETTGVRTSWHDRIVEIAVIELDQHGRVQREWCSLVNPERDMGPQAIHGITSAEARRAPTFDQLAGIVAQLLRDRIVVAHNLRFDARFLASEYERLGLQVPLNADMGLCTMNLAGQFMPGAGRSLYDCCLVAGMPLEHAHAALHDARAAARLLAHYIDLAGQPAPWHRLSAQVSSLHWPSIPSIAVSPVERRRPGQYEAHFLSRLAARLPRMREPRGDSYLDLLDQALLDRHLSDTEADALVAVAEDFHLGRYEVMALHERYLEDLAAVALADGILTDEEQSDLLTVTALLGLGPDHLHQAIDTASCASKSSSTSSGGSQRFKLAPGDIVVFTGQMDQPRDVWERCAEAMGLTVADRVTKKTRLLVAADPDSMSGKARQAQKYRIPIIHPSALARLAPGRSSSWITRHVPETDALE